VMLMLLEMKRYGYRVQALIKNLTHDAIAPRNELSVESRDR
jgi:hypothetical protein